VTEENEWRALSIDEVMRLLEHADFPWWIAGGLSIDHLVGRRLRAHADIDVLLLRKDHRRVRHLLRDWDCWAVDPPGTLRPWRAGEALPASVHDVWCRNDPEAPWQLQLMLDEGDHDAWWSRRCSLVTRPIVDLGARNAHGVPFLAPEVQLFYKAKAPRDKDQADLNAALPLLTAQQKRWLRVAITSAYGSNNPWIAEINR
jgi:aminoglycoside-2''-adenylyltransferase